MRRRILSIIMCFAMIFSLMNIETLSVFATDGYTEIYTVEDLYNVRNDLTGNYILMNDLDLSEATADGGNYCFKGNGWNPIGSDDNYGQLEFTGVFNGNGHTISGLNMDIMSAPTQIGYTGFMNLGLFANNAGTIENLILNVNICTTATIHNFVRAGGVAAINSGTINNCSVNGSIDVSSDYKAYMDNQNYNLYGYIYAGGVAGVAYEGASFTQCSNNSVIYAKSLAKKTYDKGNDMVVYAGGIVAKGKSCTVEECFNTGQISSTRYYDCPISGGAYGIAYISGNSTVRNCYNTGNIHGYGAGGISINPVDGVVENCYTIGDARADFGSSICGCPKNGYYLSTTNIYDSAATPLTEQGMRSEMSFSGFDFDDIWIIDSYADYPYPMLRNNRQEPIKISEIEIKTEPKTTYYIDDTFDVSGGVIKVYYVDGSIDYIDMTKDMVTGYDMSVEGTQNLTVTYRDQSIAYSIEVKERPEIRNVVLLSEPDKTSFIKGTKFDFAGAVARVNYADDTTEDVVITNGMTAGGDINKSGTQTITATVYGHEVSWTVTVAPLEVTAISITSQPSKLQYIEGQSIDTKGLVVSAEYNDGTSKEISKYTLDYGNSVGTQTVTVSSSGLTATFDVEFIKKTTKKIEVTSQPEKKTYVKGQKFDATGMVVTATYDNDTSEEITDYEIAEIEDSLGMQSLTISYDGKETAVEISVVEKNTESLEVTSQPKKKTYVAGERFSAAGMEIVAHYNDGTSKTVTDYTLSALPKTAGEYQITVSYEGASVKIPVTVIEKAVTKLSVTLPDKIDYLQGEEFDSTGLKVVASYNDGTTETVEDFAISGFGECKEENTMTIEYGGKTYSFTVYIHAPNDKWVRVKEPTCSAPGLDELQCEECGRVIDSVSVDMLAHEPGEWVVTKEPTCTETGEKGQHCANCDEFIEWDTVDCIPHEPGDYETVKDSTCFEKGAKEQHCTMCGELLDSQVIDYKEHTPGAYTVTEEPTCTKQGTQIQKCADCDAVVRYSYIEMTEHKAGREHVSVPATQLKAGKKSVECDVCGEELSSTLIPRLGTPEASETVFVYNEKMQAPVITICDVNGKELTEGKDFDIEYERSIEVGHYKAVVTCTGDYNDVIEVPYEIACDVHKWSDWETTLGATALATGIRTRECTACGERASETVAKLTPKIKLSATKKTIKKKKTYTLVVSGMAKGDYVSSVVSSKKTIASVSKVSSTKYKIKGIKKGKATITVKLKSGKTAKCVVTVK